MFASSVSNTYAMPTQMSGYSTYSSQPTFVETVANKTLVESASAMNVLREEGYAPQRTFVETASAPMRLSSMTPKTTRLSTPVMASSPTSTSTMPASSTTMLAGSQVFEVGQVLGSNQGSHVFEVGTTRPRVQDIHSLNEGSLMAMLAEERAQRQQLQAQMTGVLAQLAECKARLDKLDPPESPIHAAVRLIEQRGHVRVNHSTGHIQLLQPLRFHNRTTKDEPTAVFRDENHAVTICHDLVELSNIFGCPMTIEGHTKGGESDFWQSLANNRAVAVADKMVELGANPSLLATRGLPGRLGKNEVRTEIFMDITNIKDENAQLIVATGSSVPVVERDIISAATGRVVERDFVSATTGRVVERDRILPSGIQEAPVFMSSPMIMGTPVAVEARPLYPAAIRPASQATIVRQAVVM